MEFNNTKITYRLNMDRYLKDLNEFLFKKSIHEVIRDFIQQYLYLSREYIEQTIRLTPLEDFYWKAFLEAHQKILKKQTSQISEQNE